MGRKVSIFGVRGAGKTCYVYAMSQVMQAGATFGDTTISLIANDIKQQSRLNRGYAELADHKWPMGSLKTTVYDFKARLQHQDEYQEIIPSLLIRDYRGGLLQSEEDDDELDELLDSFSDSCAVVFLVDGETLLQALDPMDVDPQHREPLEANQILSARNQISFVENLFMEYKKRNHSIPPVMIVITKADLFLNNNEVECGKKLIKRYLPSVFAKGSGIDAAITTVSLGENYASAKIFPDSVFEYTAIEEDKGILLDESNDAYNVLNASIDFAEKTWATVSSEPLSILVSSDLADYDPTKPYTFMFDYYESGRPIEVFLPEAYGHSQMRCAIEMTVSNGRLISYKQYMRSYEAVSTAVLSDMFITALDGFVQILSRETEPTTINDIYIGYLDTGKESEIYADWLAKTSNNKIYSYSEEMEVLGSELD